MKQSANWKPMKVFLRHPEARPPMLALSQSIGFDLFAFLKTESGRDRTCTIPPQSVVAIPTMITVIPPPGYSILVCSRSGMAKRGVFVANAPGVIDPDYTGEILVLLFNGGWEPQFIKHEDRIAQLLFIPSPVAPLIELIATLPETERGEKGFGSTGN